MLSVQMIRVILRMMLIVTRGGIVSCNLVTTWASSCFAGPHTFASRNWEYRAHAVGSRTLEDASTSWLAFGTL